MRLVSIIIGLLFTHLSVGQTTINEILERIESNNYTLKSLRAQTDAIIVGNKVGLNPSNPTIEYIYQWGNTEQLGNKQEFHIRQSFDFPTAYRYRKQMTESLNEKAERDYLNAYNLVMLDAQRVIYRLVFQDALLNEYQKRTKHAREIANAYHIKFDEGDANILERNKADINLLNAENRLAQLQSDKQLLQQQLIRLNGGLELVIKFQDWPLQQLPLDFDEWFNANADIIPEIQSMEDNLAAKRYDEKLNKAMSLPKLTGGYSSESESADKFKGVNFGLTIPLWENKNTVKQARLNTLSMENQMADRRLQLYHGLKALYKKAGNMHKVSNSYRESLTVLSNSDMLQTALESGQISILEYMLELGIYYEAIENALNAELAFYLSVAQMKAFQVE